MRGGGGGGVREFHMTGALILLVTLLLFGTVHDPYFPKERLFPSAVSTLKQMFLKSEIVFKKKMQRGLLGNDQCK